MLKSSLNLANMVIGRLLKVFLAIEVILSVARIRVDALSYDYYAMRCPFAEMIIKDNVNRALRRDATLSGGLLRMHFHDCFVQGCDGSILIDSTKDNKAEKDSPANLSLRGYEIIDQAKQEIEYQCPGVVSCADIVAMAARDAVFMSGGPGFDIMKGRKDGRRSKIQDTFALPPPFLNSSELIRTFGQRGFNYQEMVALSGAHTLGVARCSSFKNRLTNFDSTHDVDPTLNPNVARSLSQTCRGGDDAEAPFDWTKTDFDNAYFNALQMGAGILISDQTLYDSPITKPIVNFYAMNTAMFFYDFQQAFIKMGQLDVKEDDQGEVRRNCRRIN